MKVKHVLGSIVGALFLIGAAWEPGSAPIVFADQITLEDKQLEVSAKVYSAQESKHILHANLAAKGFIPVEVTIQNQGDHAYAISMSSTSMSCAKPKEIAWKFTKSGIPRAVGLKILSFIFWPFVVPSTIDSIHSFKKHKSLVKVLSAKGFKAEDEIVLPYSMVKRMLYVHKDAYYDTFSFSLEDLNSDELVVIPIQTG